MASLVKNGKIYGLMWTDSQRSPKQCRETLKTSEYYKALNKKKQLEWGYDNRNNPSFPDEQKHDPWVQKWYETESISHSSRALDLVEKFISYKSSEKGEAGWSEDIAEKETFAMRNYIKILCLPTSVYEKWKKGVLKKKEALKLINPSKLITDITREDLKRLYYRPGVTSDNTRNSDRISMNTFLNWCISNEYLQEKPDFKPHKPQAKVPKFITPQDLKKIIDYRVEKIKGDIHYQNIMHEARGAYWIVLGWMILAGTGMRPKELSEIKINAVETDHILIGEDFSTKVRAERRVPLLYESRQAVEVLTDEKFRSLESSLRDSDYLLGRKPKYAREELSYEFTKTWKQCFPDKKRTLYNLKDFFAVRFLCDDKLPSSSGMKLNDLREILGHSSLETTQRYLKAIPYGTKIEGTIWDISYL